MLALPAAAQTQPTAAELLQRGIYAQETSGDLDGAIKIYRQIVDSHPQQREIGAQAQYRLGMALLTKGDTNTASQEIQRLGWDYPDFKDLLASVKNLNLASPDVRAVYMGQNKNFFFVGPDGRVQARTITASNLADAAQADLKKASAQIADHEAEFDWNKNATVAGAVVQIAWMNPYTILTINSGATGSPIRVFVAGANTLMRAGWNRDTLKLGDQLTIHGSPALDGSGIIQATEVNFNGQALFSRPNGPLTQNAIGAYEK